MNKKFLAVLFVVLVIPVLLVLVLAPSDAPLSLYASLIQIPMLTLAIFAVWRRWI